MGRIVQVENKILRDEFLTLEEAWVEFPLFGLFEKSVKPNGLTASTAEDAQAAAQAEEESDEEEEAESEGEGKTQREKDRETGGDYMQHAQVNALWCALEERANLVGLKVSPEETWEPDEEACEEEEDNPHRPPLKGQIVVPPEDAPKPDDVPEFTDPVEDLDPPPEEPPEGEPGVEVYWYEEGEVILPGDVDPCDVIEDDDGNPTIEDLEEGEENPAVPDDNRDNIEPTNKADELTQSWINDLWSAISQVCVRYCSPNLRREWVNLSELLADLDIGEPLDPDPEIPDPDDTEFPPTKFIEQNGFSIIPDRPDVILYRRYKEGTVSVVENVMFNDNPEAIGGWEEGVEEEDPIVRGKGGFGEKTFGLSIPAGTPTFVEHINEAYRAILALKYIPMDIIPTGKPNPGFGFSEANTTRTRPAFPGCITPQEHKELKDAEPPAEGDPWGTYIPQAFNTAGEPKGTGGAGGNQNLGGRVDMSSQSRCSFPFDKSIWQVINRTEAGFTAYRAKYQRETDDPKFTDDVEYDDVVFRFDLTNSQNIGGIDDAAILEPQTLWTLSIIPLPGAQIFNAMPYNLYQQGDFVHVVGSFAPSGGDPATRELTDDDFDWDPDFIPQPTHNDDNEVRIMNTFIENIIPGWKNPFLGAVAPIPVQNNTTIDVPNRLGSSNWSSDLSTFHLCARVSNFKFQEGAINEPEEGG
jgi:hypothetical protein